MSPTKYRAQGTRDKVGGMINNKYSVSPITYHLSHTAGFTLIEMIVAISILGIVSLIGTGLLFTSLSSSGKAEIDKEVRQNGNYALSVMEGLIISSKNIACPTPPAANASKEIDVTDINGQLTQFICDDSADHKISSVSASAGTFVLTATNVAVTNCNFTCATTVGNPTTVGIGFSVSQVGSSGRPNEKSSASFETQVSARNY